MKNFNVFYRWQDRDYVSVFPGRNAAAAVALAPLQLMNGARIVGVEVSQ